MGKYSLVVKNALDNSIHYIKAMNLDTLKWEKSVNLKDIDYWTSQFSDKFSFLENLYHLGIIDFKYGNTYIETIYGGRDYHFKNLYNNNKINDIAISVLNGEIKKQALAEQPIKEFFSLVARENFMSKLQQTKYINKALKSKLINYIEGLKVAEVRPEKIEEIQDLYIEIRKELMHYKSFRGMVLFMSEYELDYDYSRIKTSQIQEPLVIRNTSPKEKTSDFHNMTDTERYNRKYDEFLSEEEYEKAYHGTEDNWHPHRR